MSEKNKIQLALLSGGRSAEREVSLAGARGVKQALDPSRYDIKNYDPATDLERLVRDAPRLDAAFILLHGRYGEDGTIQGLLDLIDLPYQGSGVLGSALAMDKHLAKTIYQQAGIPTPPWICLHSHRDTKVHIEGPKTVIHHREHREHRESKEKSIHHTKEIVSRLGLPVIVKPRSQGSSVGMSKVVTEDKLVPAIEEAFKWDSGVIVEAFIKGREITGGVLGLEELLTLPVVEIIPDSKYSFFEYDAKYLSGASEEICPADIPKQAEEGAQALAAAAHKALQLRAYSRTDMILTDTAELFVLETNTIPGMTPTSLFPMAAKTAGLSLSKLLDRLIEMALSVNV
ncbi:MAG: D-alanine--D-alanine ligase [Desulfuromonadales bacterium C00003093]|nr:MAG: D-alanine--D-alanine ligase [Desulfuromonadales bacterium C00003093]